jgi:mono/diheme cytochrome c family protein
MRIALVVCVVVVAAFHGASPSRADDRGYQLLVGKAYLPEAWDDAVFDALWHTWEEPLHARAAKASSDERRKMAYSRYGLTPRPGEPDDMPLQYVRTGSHGWTPNCFACHGGKVAGQVIPGLPNSHYAMQTLFEEMRAVKLVQGKLGKDEILGSLFPMSSSNGTTNAVMFGVAVTAVRDLDLNFDTSRPLPKFLHHDMDAPPWWNVKKKKWLYADGSIENDHRALMPFLLSGRQNTGEKVRGWEKDFEQIYDWILTLEPPKFPFSIDRELAGHGRTVFNDHCARCHGTYGPDGKYPNKIVPIEEVETDRARLDSLGPEQLGWYEKSWLSHYGKKRVNAAPGGYVAPPLDGIWASAPYLHNGSVPTLWHVMHPDERPKVWRRSEDGYDRAKLGLEFTAFEEMAAEARTLAQKRQYFDTRKFGKSANGHRFPDELTEDQKAAVLEYLKTL